MKHATIELPDDLAESVDAEARRRNTSFSEVVRELIVQGLGSSEESPRSIPWAGLFHDPALAAEGLDDILSDLARAASPGNTAGHDVPQEDSTSSSRSIQ